jgi:voltage-gated potassium channel
MDMMAKAMQDHVIVVGYRFLGKYVVESLKRLNAEFIVITRVEAQLETLRSNGIPALYAPVTHVYEALKEAHVEKASTLISTLENDGENMLAVLTAKKLNNKIKTISIVNDRELVEGVKSAGADVVIPYFQVMGQMIAASSLSKEISGVFFSEDLKSKFIAEFKIEFPRIVYKEIRGICPVLMASRGDEVIFDFKDDFEFKPGDFVYVVTDQECIEAFRNRLDSLRKRKA